MTKYRQQGQAGLARRKPSGPDCRLTDEQLVQLLTELAKGAEHHGFSGAVWTRPRVDEVIKKLFGVSYDPFQVGRLLTKAGWSRQKPKSKHVIGPPKRQNPQAVQQWRQERLPELKKSED